MKDTVNADIRSHPELSNCPSGHLERTLFWLGQHLCLMAEEARTPRDEAKTDPSLKPMPVRGAWLAQSVERATLDPQGREFEPHVRCRDYIKITILF